MLRISGMTVLVVGGIFGNKKAPVGAFLIDTEFQLSASKRVAPVPVPSVPGE